MTEPPQAASALPPDAPDMPAAPGPEPQAAVEQPAPMAEMPDMPQAHEQIQAFQAGLAEMPLAPQPEAPATPELQAAVEQPIAAKMPEMPLAQEGDGFPAFQPDAPDMPAAPGPEPQAAMEQPAPMAEMPDMQETPAFHSGAPEMPASLHAPAPPQMSAGPQAQPETPARPPVMAPPAQAAQMLHEMAQAMRAAQPDLPPMPESVLPSAEQAGAPLSSPMAPAQDADASQQAPAPPVSATGAASAGEQPVERLTSGEFTAMARSLLDVMGMPDSAAQPQERALAASALLPLIGHVSARFHRELTDRLCLMERPPLGLVRAILGLRDARLEQEILLKARLPEHFLLETVRHEEENKIHLITRRRNLTTAMSAAIVSHGTVQDILELLRNSTARLDEGAFWKIAAKARESTILHAPLATHKDLPPAVAFAAFWYLPPALRRFVMSRFLVDSGVLGRILRIALPKTPPCDPQDRILRIETMIELIVEGDEAAARAKMVRLTGLDEAACARIIEDSQGEAMTVLLKALGYGRSLFGPIIQRLAESPMAALDKERNLSELHNTFAALSHDKAWELLLYWHWQARGIGPYEGSGGVL